MNEFKKRFPPEQYSEFYIGKNEEYLKEFIIDEYRRGYNDCLKERGLSGEKYQHLYL